MKRKVIYTIIVALLAVAAVVTTTVLAAKGLTAMDCGFFGVLCWVACIALTNVFASIAIAVSAIMNIIEANR